MKRLSVVAVVVLALLAFSSKPAVALEDFGVEPDKKMTKAFEDLADACYECAGIAEKKGLNLLARSYYNHALQYEYDHKKSRKRMGYKKKKKKWVLVEDMLPLKDSVPQAKRAEREQALIDETASIRRKAADRIFEFATNETLDTRTRMLAVFHTIRMLPDHRGAQKAIRSRLEGGFAIHALDDLYWSARDAWIEKESAGEPIEGKTEYETKTGLTLVKTETDWIVWHVKVGGPDTKAWLEDFAKFGEANRNQVFEALGLEEPKPPSKRERKLHLSVLDTREDFATFIKKCSGHPDAAYRKEVAAAGGGMSVYNPFGTVWLCPGKDSPRSMHDAISHELGSMEIQRHTGDAGYWLMKGFGYLMSSRMSSTTTTRFFRVKKSQVIDSGGVESLPGFADTPCGWRLLVAMSVSAGKEVDSLALAKAKEFTNHSMAHAFAFVEFMLLEKKEKFKAFLLDALKERNRRRADKLPPETNVDVLNRLVAAMEVDQNALHEEFCAWVLKTYVRLPSEED